MKHEIKNLSPDVPQGGDDSIYYDGIYYMIYRQATDKEAGSVLVSMLESGAIKRENNEKVLRIPETIKKDKNIYIVVGICVSAITVDVNKLILPPTLEIFSGASFSRCSIGRIEITTPETDIPPMISVENSSLIFDKSGERLIYASNKIPIGVAEWRGTKIIGEYAFRDYEGEEITIPHSVEYVERLAFAKADNLRTVYFEEHIPCGVNISTFNLVYENISIKLIRKP